MKKFLVSYSWLILLFLYFPMMVLMVYSFNDSRINAEWEGFTFHWYTDLFQKQDVIDAFINSMTIAVITTVVTTILGVFLRLPYIVINIVLKGQLMVLYTYQF